MSASGEGKFSGRFDPLVEEPMEGRRYFEILRRSRRLIGLIVVGVTLVAFGVSLLLPATYRSTARIVMDNSADPLAPSDAVSVVRELATAQKLVMTPRILSLAAQSIPGESEKTLEKKVVVKADSQANIIDVSASDNSRERAAVIANAVANAFIDDQRILTGQNLERARAILLSRLRSLGRSPSNDAQRSALSGQLGELELRAATADLRFRLAEPAERPDKQASPHPIRTALLALIASIVIAVIVVLGRDQLRPQITDARELSRLVDLPVLARISERYGRRGDPTGKTLTIESDAFRTLRGRANLLLPPDRQHVVLVTSAVNVHGKAGVSAGLARALAETGHATLLVAADLDNPGIDERFGITDAPGFADVLRAAPVRGHAYPLPGHPWHPYVALIADRTVDAFAHGNLVILAAGKPSPDTSHGLQSEAVRAFGNALRELEYAYVVIDAPPLLVTNDSLILAGVTDQIVVVAQLESLKRPVALDMREVLDEIGKPVLGLIVIGAHVGVIEESHLGSASRGELLRLSPRRLWRNVWPRAARRGSLLHVGSKKNRVLAPRWIRSSRPSESDGGPTLARESTEAGDPL